MFKNKTFAPKTIYSTLLVIAMLISLFVISPIVSTPSNRSFSIKELDEQKLRATGVATTVTAASFGISLIKDDIGTPIANELADLSSILIFIMCIIYLEKFLLTTTGFVSFSILVPVACGLFLIGLLYSKDKWRVWGIKVLILAFVLFAAIPSGVAVTKMVETTFEDSIQNVFNQVEQYTKVLEDTQSSEATNLVKQILNDIGDGINRLLEIGKNTLSVMTDAIAVLIITTCAIPLLTILLFVWITHILFGLQIKLPSLYSLAKSIRNTTEIAKDIFCDSTEE